MPLTPSIDVSPLMPIRCFISLIAYAADALIIVTSPFLFSLLFVFF